MCECGASWLDGGESSLGEAVSLGHLGLQVTGYLVNLGQVVEMTYCHFKQ